MSLAQQEFTDAGRSMLGRAQNGEVLTISKIVVGSGVASVPSDLWPLTALIVHEMDVTISAKLDYGQGTLLVEGSFLSNTAPHVFQLRELGIMAHIASEADRLYSVSNVYTDPPDTIDPASPSTQAFKVKLIIDRIPTSSLVIQIGPSENVIGQNLATAADGPGVYADAAGNVLSFKRLVAGTGISITEDAPESAGTKITISERVLTQNLDLYVPASYVNPPPGTQPSQFFATIQAAHDYLLQFVIPTDKTATIHVDAGTFTGIGIYFSHPDSRQIYLIGRPRVDHAVTAINYVDATHKNAILSSVPLDLSVNQLVYLAGCNHNWSGGALITAISGSTVTLNVFDRGGRTPYATNDTTALHPNMRLSFYPTHIVHASGGTSGHAIYGNNGLNVQYLSIDGSGTTITPGACIHLSDGLVQDCQVYNATRGLAMGYYGSGAVNVNGDFVATECSYGVLANFTTFLNQYTYINSCTFGATASGGVSLQIGEIATSYPAFANINHCAYGIQATLNGTTNGNVINLGNNNVGIAAILGGICGHGATGMANLLLNNGTDLYAQGMGYIQYQIAGTQTPTCSPSPANTIGNQNSYIYVIP